jgi:AraC-like DNA-binding protein
MDALADTFYVSKYHMMRQFRQETGLTVYEYLTQRRLLHARDLIEKGSRATEACYRSGFRSYSSFTRAYAKIFGTTPTGRMDAAREREESYE